MRGLPCRNPWTVLDSRREFQSPLNGVIPVAQFTVGDRPARAEAVVGNEIALAETVVLLAVAGDRHPTADPAGAKPIEASSSVVERRIFPDVDEAVMRHVPRPVRAL